MNRREFNLGLLQTLAISTLDLRADARASEPLRVNGARLNQHIAALAEFGRNPQGGVSRVAYSEADARGREYVLSLMEAAKL